MGSQTRMPRINRPFKSSIGCSTVMCFPVDARNLQIFSNRRLHPALHGPVDALYVSVCHRLDKSAIVSFYRHQNATIVCGLDWYMQASIGCAVRVIAGHISELRKLGQFSDSGVMLIVNREEHAVDSELLVDKLLQLPNVVAIHCDDMYYDLTVSGLRSAHCNQINALAIEHAMSCYHPNILCTAQHKQTKRQAMKHLKQELERQLQHCAQRELSCAFLHGNYWATRYLWSR